MGGIFTLMVPKPTLDEFIPSDEYDKLVEDLVDDMLESGKFATVETAGGAPVAAQPDKWKKVDLEVGGKQLCNVGDGEDATSRFCIQEGKIVVHAAAAGGASTLQLGKYNLTANADTVTVDRVADNKNFLTVADGETTVPGKLSLSGFSSDMNFGNHYNIKYHYNTEDGNKTLKVTGKDIANNDQPIMTVRNKYDQFTPAFPRGVIIGDNWKISGEKINNKSVLCIQQRDSTTAAFNSVFCFLPRDGETVEPSGLEFDYDAVGWDKNSNMHYAGIFLE